MMLTAQQNLAFFVHPHPNRFRLAPGSSKLENLIINSRAVLEVRHQMVPATTSLRLIGARP
jgi:hypothetical protein